MFADSLCDSSWANRSHRGWTALASVTLQALAVGGLLALPLLYNQSLPQLRVMGADLIAPAPPQAPSRMLSASTSAGTASGPRALEAPHSVPLEIAQGDDGRVPPPIDPTQLSVGRGDGDSRNTGVPNSVGSGINIAAAPPTPPVVRQDRVSRMMEGNLVSRIQPVYPAIAIRARIQGAVVLQAIISREGTIENLQVLSGHPLLAPAALAAVRQWRYRPYSLNGEPVEVDTQITVNFVLGG